MTDNDLRRRVLLSLQRALVGEITPEMRAVAVRISAEKIEIWLYVDEGSRAEIAEDFDAGAITQVVADCCSWPERGDPTYSFHSLQVPKGQMLLLSGDAILVFARSDANTGIDTCQTLRP